MELIDILSASGKPTGRTAPRSDAHRLGLWHRTVHVWIFAPGSGLLFQKRSLQKESNPGRWDVSAAGHIEAGQSSIDAAVRETREELGLTLENAELKPLFSIKHTYRKPDGTFVDNEFSDIYLSVRPCDRSILRLQVDEVEDVRFIQPHELLVQVNDCPGDFVDHRREYERLVKALFS
jgi:isopentenyldiphosphate isomerase